MADGQLAGRTGNAGLPLGVLLCLASMSSIQFGSAFSATAISAYGPSTTTFFRLLMAAAARRCVPTAARSGRARWHSAPPWRR